jgi:hypothetical protein
MISFMVLGAPRTGTTWLANLLTTDSTLCYHDPLLENTPEMLDKMLIPGKRLGIADTSALLCRSWICGHPAKKIVLWRPTPEINASLERLGLKALDPVLHRGLSFEVPKAKLIYWEYARTAHGAREVCEYLGVPFDEYRFQEIVKMNIQPEYRRLPIDPEAVRDLVQRQAEVMKQ